MRLFGRYATSFTIVKPVAMRLFGRSATTVYPPLRSQVISAGCLGEDILTPVGARVVPVPPLGSVRTWAAMS